MLLSSSFCWSHEDVWVANFCGSISWPEVVFTLYCWEREVLHNKGLVVQNQKTVLFITCSELIRKWPPFMSCANSMCCMVTFFWQSRELNSRFTLWSPYVLNTSGHDLTPFWSVSAEVWSVDAEDKGSGMRECSLFMGHLLWFALTHRAQNMSQAVLEPKEYVTYEDELSCCMSSRFF